MTHGPLVRSVERAVQILEALLTSPNGLRLVDLSEELSLHKTTVFRLLRTLAAMRMVRKDETDERYRWDPLRWLIVASTLQSKSYRLELIEEMLQGLVNFSNQTAILSVPDRRQRAMLKVACVLPTSGVMVDLRNRMTVPLHAVADGKLYLSTLSPEELASYLDRDLASYTPHTVTAAEPLRAQLEEIRRQGYALTRQEFVPNAAALSLPVPDEHGAMAASLALIGPLEQFTEENIAAWLPRMRAVAAELAQVIYSLEPSVATGSTALVGPPPKQEVAQSETKFRKNYRVL